MPPSPVLRFSPVRELRRENHKRGHSFESGLHLKEKDDDLTLFNDMQNRERDNFLLQPVEDFDESLPIKLTYFSDLNLGISIPVRGESSDLLNADGEKNDYDWLLTPPDTPLFPSLDDETPATNLTEKSYRTGRTSESPHRSSPSPRSGYCTFQSRGRPSSAPRSSPTPVSRSTMPSRRPSTPNKLSAPAPRSSTPTLQRTNTGVQQFSSVSRGTSPGRSTRGNSASPKLQAWQSTLPGFSVDPPPNLRTSLSDHPASHVKGSSPASRNGKDSFSKVRRQSMSPTASRSASSSYSYDRDLFSSQSKGSVASSGDDDMDSLQSVIVGRSNHPTARKNEAFSNSRSVAFSKKPTRSLPSSCAPKRYIDSAVRQMDDHRIPQNMFRPLLSSVPSTTFYVGKAKSAHHRNSSVSTSSNASSEQGASFAPDTDDLATECAKASLPDAQEELFIFYKVEEVNEDIQHEVCDGKPCDWHGNCDGSIICNVEKRESERLTSNYEAAAIDETAAEPANDAGELSDVGCDETMPSCSLCVRNSLFMERMDGNADVCGECAKKSGLLIVTQSTTIHSEMALEENKFHDELEPAMGIPKLPKMTSDQDMPNQQERHVEQGLGCLPDSFLQLMVAEGDQHLEEQQSENDQHLLGQPNVSYIESECVTANQHLQHFNGHPNLKVGSSEGVGISVLLLKRSNSSKWPVVEGRAFTATNIPYNDPSYARDNSNAMKSFTGQGSASASSSVDLGSSRQTEARLQRQLSSRKADLGNFRDDSNVKPVIARSFSGISNNAYEALVHAKNTNEETRGASESIEVFDGHSPFASTAVLEEHKFDCTDGCSRTDASTLELSSHTRNVLLEENLAAEFVHDEDLVSSGNVDDLNPSNATSMSDIEVVIRTAEPSVTLEDVILYEVDASSVIISGILENVHGNTTVSKNDSASSPKNIVEAFQEPSISATSEKGLFSSLIVDMLDNAECNDEEPTVTVDGPRGNKSRSLALEEATDTILFCSSIIHNLAYEAATIAMEKEDVVPLVGSRPMVTILGKSDYNRQDVHGRSSSKRMPKSQKARQRRLEADAKTTSTKTENDENIEESLPHDSKAPNKVDSMKPPKLESKCNCSVM
ncbi:uncharacterized protein LOC131239953 isoform X2 [Magnolia sinica]|uniref:uncharacterized protein LOC131239953 isoform X2 n=1 Tax=Magnolia sinica TaxID=86752 RepID=UPI0026593D17|nr:uncharacterized protein LOC131239953 isoform X2 [Magnolia sinica]